MALEERKKQVTAWTIGAT